MTLKNLNFDLLQALQLSGVPLDSEVMEGITSKSAALSVEQIGTIIESAAMDLSGGFSGFMLSAALYNDSHTVIHLDEFRLKLPWATSNFRWLESTHSRYSFRDDSIEFEPDVVLNHLAKGRGKLNPGGHLEGLLLGLAEGPIPEEYRDRQAVETILQIFDTRGCSTESTFRLQVSRMCRRPKARAGVRDRMLINNINIK